jgi:hypothetical protein
MIVKQKDLTFRFTRAVPVILGHTFTAPRKQLQGGIPNRFDIGGLPCVVYEWECLGYTLVHWHFNAPLDGEIELYRPSESGYRTRIYCSDHPVDACLWRYIAVPPEGINVLTWVTVTYGGDDQLKCRDADWHLPSGFRRQHSLHWMASPLPLGIQVKFVK